MKPHKMLHYPRLAALAELVATINRQGIDGSIVECGVAHGGSAGLLGKLTERGHRPLWLFDSWEELPEPAADDVSYLGRVGYKGLARAPQEEVEHFLFERLGLNSRRIQLVKGNAPTHWDASR
ncbi:MAG: TylF/MycF/NovP-related O-methyltransferase [Gaiellaceae bacterium]